jgi:hypothetical protein
MTAPSLAGPIEQVMIYIAAPLLRRARNRVGNLMKLQLSTSDRQQRQPQRQLFVAIEGGLGQHLQGPELECFAWVVIQSGATGRSGTFNWSLPSSYRSYTGGTCRLYTGGSQHNIQTHQMATVIRGACKPS